MIARWILLLALGGATDQVPRALLLVAAEPWVVGLPTRVTFAVEGAAGASVEFPAVGKELGSVLLVGVAPDPAGMPADAWRRTFVAIPTLSGRIEIPAVPLVLSFADAPPQRLHTEAIGVEVRGAVDPAGDGALIDDLALLPIERPWPWRRAALVLLLGLVGVASLRVRRRRTVAATSRLPAAAPPDPAPAARAALQALLAQAWPDEAAVLRCQLAAADVLRRFAAERLSTPLLQRTTEEAARLLAQVFDPAGERLMLEILESADRSKYRGRVPDQAVVREQLERALAWLCPADAEAAP